MKQIPYGVFPSPYWGLADDTDIVMGDWKSPGGAQKIMLDWKLTEETDDPVKAFNEWQLKQIEHAAMAIWPRYDFATQAWVGDAQNHADEMTKMELGIMKKAFQKDGQFYLKSKPNCPTYKSDLTHEHLFNYEDSKRSKPKDRPEEWLAGRLNPWNVLFLYEDTLTSEQRDLAKIVSNIGYLIEKKVAGFLWFKGQLQRPRPYQAALLFSHLEFHVESAFTAMHSSIPSGHSFMGALMACSVLEAWLDREIDATEDQLKALAHFGMDQGDRRVFAGVHYPSDNVVSWALAVNLIPKIYRHSGVILAFMQNAIKSHSAVYDVIKNEYSKHKVFLPLMNYVDQQIFPESKAV